MRRLVLLNVTLLLAATFSWHAFGAQPGSDGSGSGGTATLIGKLIPNPNGTDRNGITPYAVLDQAGNLRGYVRPAPGVQLRPYCGQRVELQGTIDAVSGVQGVHFTAQRIVAAERPLKTAYRQTANVRGVRQTVYQDTGEGARSIAVGDALKKADAPAASSRAAGPAIAGPGAEMLPSTEPLPDGGPMPGTPMEAAVEGGCSCGDGGECGECGGYRPFLSCLGTRGGFYADVDYLLWWTEGMRVPPLVTSGPTATQPGYLPPGGATFGQKSFAVTDPETGASTTTTVLFGNDSLFTGDRSGARIRLGAWLNCCQTIGLEGEYAFLADSEVHFRDWSDGNPIISRPFTDVTRPVDDPQNVEKVAYPRGNPGSIDGAVSVDALTKFQSAAARLRLNCCTNPCNDCCRRWFDRIDFVIGWRFLRLDDAVNVTEELTSTDPTALGAFLVNDYFSSRTMFNGCEAGFIFERNRGPWSLMVSPKLAMGDSHEIVNIYGSTRTTGPDGTQGFAPGGLLALSSNIGHYTKDEFAVVPEVGLTLGYQITCRLRATLGYNFLYWSKVARAGDQIDIKVNPTLIPGAGTPSGDTSHPAFTFQQTDFWAQGLTFGLDYRW